MVSVVPFDPFLSIVLLFLPLVLIISTFGFNHFYLSFQSFLSFISIYNSIELFLAFEILNWIHPAYAIFGLQS